MNRITSRLNRLLKQVGTIEAANNDDWKREPEYIFWTFFREVFLGTLEQAGHTEVLELVRKAIAGNERHVFGPGKGPCIAATGDDTRLWVMSNTAWMALVGFPGAKHLCEQAVEHAFELAHQMIDREDVLEVAFKQTMQAVREGRFDAMPSLPQDAPQTPIPPSDDTKPPNDIKPLWSE